MAFNAGSIEATLDLDRDPFQRVLDEARAEGEDFAGETFTATLDLDGLREVLDGIAAVTAAADRVGSLSPTLTVGAAGTAGVISDLATITAASNVVASLSPTVHVETSGVPAAIAGLGATGAAATAAGGSASSAGGAFGGMGLTIVGIAAIAAPAVGLISAAIAALPAVIGVAGGALGAITLGIDGIKAAAAGLQAPFDQLKASVSTAFVQGLQPAMTSIAALMPTLSTGFVAVAGSLSGIATQVTAVLASREGLAAIAAIFQQTAGFLTAISPAIVSFTQNFLTLAQAGSAFLTPLAAGLSSAAASFGQMLAQANQSGVLTAALKGLGDTVGILAQFLVNLMGAGLQAWAVLSGPMNTALGLLGQVIVALMPALTALTNMFLSVLNPVLAALVPIIISLTPAFTQLANMIGTLLGGALTAITPLLVQLGQMLGGVITQALTAITPLLPVIVKGFGTLATALLPLVPMIGDLATTLIGALAPIVPVIAAAFTQVVTVLVTLIPPLLQIVQMLLPPLTQLITAIAPIIPQVAFAFLQVTAALIPLLPPFLQLVQLVLPLLMNLLAPLINVLPPIVSIIAGGLVTAITSFANVLRIVVTVLTTVINAIITFAAQATTWFNAFITTVGAAWNAFWAAIRAVVTVAWNAVSAYIQAGILLVTTIWNTAWAVVSAAWTAFWAGIRLVATTAWGIVQAFFTGALAVFTNAWNTVWNAISAAWTAFWGLISSAAQAGWGLVSGFFTGALAAFQALWQGAWDTVSAVFTGIWNGIRDTATGVWDAITGAFQKGVDAAKGVLNKLVDGVNVVLGFLHIGLVPRLEAGGILGPALAAGGTIGSVGVGVHYLAAGGSIGSGFVTNGPTAVVGEGRSAYPEYVIPTDPAYRSRAQTLYSSLGPQLMASGGVVGSAGIPQLADGGIFSFIGNPVGAMHDLLNGALSPLPEPFRGITAGYGNHLIDQLAAWLKEMFDKIGGTLFGGDGGGGAAVPAVGPIVDIVRATAAQFGWGDGPEWAALSWVIQHESGFNPNAQNPTSTAYGLFQFLDGTWGSTGIGKTSNPSLQALAGMRYIAGKYGDPLGAQAFWQAHHWYDSGGGLPPGLSAALNTTGGMETVLPLPPDLLDNLLKVGTGAAGTLTPAQWQRIVGGASGSDSVTTEMTGVRNAVEQVRDLLLRRGAAANITVADHSGDPGETARSTVLALRLS